MTLPGPFSNPVLHVVSIDTFPFENIKNLFAPQPKMLCETESHQKKKKKKEVSEIELRKNWFFQKFKCKISFYNIWEPKMSQLIVIGSHWGFAGCSLVSQWGSLRVIWWSFGGHSGF